MKTTWEFVEKYYPNYHTCNEIAKNNDLKKLLDEEFEDGDEASKLLKDEYENDLNNSWIEIDYKDSLFKIYEKAIESYLKTL